MKILFEPGDAKYVVLRMKPGMDRDQMPADLDGRWDPAEKYAGRSVRHLGPRGDEGAAAWPTNGFEVRADGEVAQVWVVAW